MYRVTMAKKRRKKKNFPVEQTEKKSVSKTALLLLFALVGATVAALTVYRFLMQGPYFRVTLIAYMVIGGVAALGYVLYNRGFSRRGVTADMLPSDWSDEKKNEYIEDGVRRMKRSRWVLILAFAIFATLAFDLIELYMWPLVKGMLGIE